MMRLRDLGVIPLLILVFVQPIYNLNSIDPYNAMSSNALELTPSDQSLNDNLEPEGPLQYRGHPGEVDPYNLMPSRALELTPDEQSLNGNLELWRSLQYSGHPGEVDPHNSMPSNDLELTPYEQALNDNLELGGSLQYRSHPGGVYPDNELSSDSLELTPYEQSLNDNLELGETLQYRGHPGGESPFPYNMYQAPVHHEANYRSPYDYYRRRSAHRAKGCRSRHRYRPNRVFMSREFQSPFSARIVNTSPERCAGCPPPIGFGPFYEYDIMYRRASPCNQPLNRGKLCNGRIERWYYNVASNTCLMFIYEGCLGNSNNFHSKKECEQTCKAHIDKASPESIFLHNMNSPPVHHEANYPSPDIMYRRRHRSHTDNASPERASLYNRCPPPIGYDPFPYLHSRSPHVMYRPARQGHGCHSRRRYRSKGIFMSREPAPPFLGKWWDD